MKAKNRPTNEEIVKKIEEEAQINIPIAKGILENDLFKFNKMVLKAEEGKGKVPLANFHKDLCKFVTLRKNKKKLILIPRGHLKSTLVTVGYTLQQLLADPTKRILIANATYDLACSFLTDIKRHLKFNDKIHMVWGDLSRSPDAWSQNKITLSTAKGMHGKKEANVTAMGVESNLTSQHYDLITMDDVVNKDYVNTSDQIQKTIDFYKECLNLLEPNGQAIVIGTRWHDSDLYGWIMDTDNNVIGDFEIMIKKAFEDGPNGEKQYLFPDKFSKRHLAKLREQQGPYVFSCQYLNDPIPEEDADFKRGWFQQFEFTDLRGKPLNKFTMIDPALSVERSADFTAIVTVGVDNHHNIFIMDIRRIQAKPEQVIDEIFKVYEQWHPIFMGIEEVAFQKVLRYALHQEMNNRGLWLPLREVKPDRRTKDQRIRGLQPLYANRKIFHNKSVTNTNHLEDELLRFPVGKHDDVIDALSYGLDFWYPGKRKIRTKVQNWLYA
jgi:predicted phage terminase large subunit-like protein